MAAHLSEVSQETRAIFSTIREDHRRVLEKFYEGFTLALKDVYKGWKQLKPREKKIVFDKVQVVAMELIVDKDDGGGADNGLSRGTFDGYVCKVKRALIYNVPLEIAEKTTNQILQQAKEVVETDFKDDPGTYESKMVKAYHLIKEQHKKQREKLRKAAEDAKGNGIRTIETPFTLPDPDDYKADDEGSKALLSGGIQGMLSWLQTKSLQQHLEKKMPAAKVLKAVLGELMVYENQNQTDTYDPSRKPAVA